MRLNFLALFLIVSTVLFSQNSQYIIHSSVGEMIDLNEKDKYLLYPEYSDSFFISSTFYKTDSLLINKLDGSF